MAGGGLGGGGHSRSEQRDFAVGKGGSEESSGAPPGGRTRNGEGGEGDGERATKT